MKKVCVFFSVLFCSTLALAQQTPEPYKSPTESKIKGSSSSKYNFKVIEGQNHTFGYDIFENDDTNPKIHQPSLPGMPGNDGFKTKMDAQKVAKLAIEKMYKGEMPPTITQEELKKLGVIK